MNQEENSHKEWHGDTNEPVFRQKETITLSPVDQEQFVGALLNPAPPTDAMKRAAEAHRHLIQLITAPPVR